MAVPKKRTSKAKKNQRKFNWKKKALKQSIKSISINELKEFKKSLGTPSNDVP